MTALVNSRPQLHTLRQQWNGLEFGLFGLYFFCPPLGIREALQELKIPWTGASAKHSEHTLTRRLDTPTACLLAEWSFLGEIKISGKNCNSTETQTVIVVYHLTNSSNCGS